MQALRQKATLHLTNQSIYRCLGERTLLRSIALDDVGIHFGVIVAFGVAFSICWGCA